MLVWCVLGFYNIYILLDPGLGVHDFYNINILLALCLGCT